MPTIQYVKCYKCKIPANGGQCAECGAPFCKECIIRHPNCQGGR